MPRAFRDGCAPSFGIDVMHLFGPAACLLGVGSSPVPGASFMSDNGNDGQTSKGGDNFFRAQKGNVISHPLTDEERVDLREYLIRQGVSPERAKAAVGELDNQ
jgi:hypothetical protein